MPFMVTGRSGRVFTMSSHSGAVPPSFSRLALPVDSEDYAFEFILDTLVSG